MIGAISKLLAGSMTMTIRSLAGTAPGRQEACSTSQRPYRERSRMLGMPRSQPSDTAIARAVRTTTGTGRTFDSGMAPGSRASHPSASALLLISRPVRSNISPPGPPGSARPGEPSVMRRALSDSASGAETLATNAAS